MTANKITELAHNLHTQWRSVIEKAARDCEEQGRSDAAEKYRRCRLFTGDEDLAGLCSLLGCAQGSELLMQYRFPSLSALRLFKPYGPERYGVYIDAGEITLSDPKRVVLAGDTTATIHCSSLDRYEVFVIYGAKAVVEASGWAVVFVKTMQGTQCIRNRTDNALIL